MGEAADVDIEAWRRDFDGLDQGDWDRVQRLFAEEIEWWGPPDVPDSMLHHGRAEVREFWDGILEAAELWEVVPKEFTRGEDDVLVRSEMRMKGRSTGMSLETDFWQVFTFREGRIIRQRGFFDREQALAAFDGRTGEATVGE